MSRIKIEVPHHFIFVTEIPVRITDLNYGAHVGNDTILSLMHEARMQWLFSLGYRSELNIEGLGLIMADAAIEFKSELFYGEKTFASVAVAGVTKIGFNIYYKLEKETSGQRTVVAMGKTGMLCFDYQKRKISSLPERFSAKISSSE